MTATFALPGAIASARSRFQRIRAIPVWGTLFLAVVGYLVLIEGVLQLAYGKIDIPFVDIGLLEIGFGDRAIPREVFLQSAVVGALYALVAMGLIVVYRANQVINFAQAQLGAVPAVIAALLIARQQTPYLLVLPIVLLGSALLGAGVEVTIIRRFSSAPRLILTVATIGVGLLLVVLEYYAKVWIPGELLDGAGDRIPTPFDALSFRLGVVTFTGNHIAAVVITGVLVAAFGAFFRYTDLGIAVRASAENANRASLLGIPVRRVSTIVWVMASVLSAVAVFLRIPLIGLNLGGSISLAVLQFGLVAAAMAKFDDLPLALLSGVFISVVTEAVSFQTRRASLVAPILLAIVLIALLTQTAKKGRAFSTGVSTWQAVKDVRNTPTELRKVREVRLARLGLAVVGTIFALAFPFVIGAEESGLAVELVVFAMVGVSLVILTGWSGQISLGQFAITGVGAIVGGGLAANYNYDFFVVLVIAGVAGAVTALLIGLPALRIQGLLLAVTTLSFAFAVQEFVLQHEWFDFLKPGSGRFVEPPILYGIIDLGSQSEVFGIELRPDTKIYYLALVFLGLFCAAASSLRRSRTGRLLVGVRDNPKGVQAYGINVSQVRLFAFALSGFIAGVAGAIFAYQLGSVSDSVFTPDKSLLALTMVVIGGAATLPGAVIGALFVFGLPLMPYLKDVDQIRQLISGFGVLAVLLFLPGGLSELVYGWRDTFLRWVAAKHDIHVPSLVADSLVTEGHDEFHGFETVSLGEEPADEVPEVAPDEIEVVASEEVPA